MPRRLPLVKFMVNCTDNHAITSTNNNQKENFKFNWKYFGKWISLSSVMLKEYTWLMMMKYVGSDILI